MAVTLWDKEEGSWGFLKEFQLDGVLRILLQQWPGVPEVKKCDAPHLQKTAYKRKYKRVLMSQQQQNANFWKRKH